MSKILPFRFSQLCVASVKYFQVRSQSIYWYSTARNNFDYSLKLGYTPNVSDKRNVSTGNTLLTHAQNLAVNIIEKATEL